MYDTDKLCFAICPLNNQSIVEDFDLSPLLLIAYVCVLDKSDGIVIVIGLLKDDGENTSRLLSSLLHNSRRQFIWTSCFRLLNILQKDLNPRLQET